MFFFESFALLGFLLPVAVLGAVVLVVVALTTRRGEADPRGRRPYAVYLLATMFVSLLVLVGALGQIGSALAREVVDEDAVWAVSVGAEFRPEHGYGGPDRAVYGPGRSPAIPGILRALLAAIPAGAVFLFHRRRLNELVDREVPSG